ncbi:MAG: hypothetical protein ACHWZW_09120 [Spirulina sp.]
MSQRHDITFFIDWSIGQQAVPSALRSVGAKIETHGDHFAPETLDVDWLRIVSDRNWVVITKDEAIGRRPNEVETIARAGAKVFILASGNLTRQQMVDILVRVIVKLENFAQSNPAPFIAKIYQDRHLKMWRNHAQLLKMLKSS